MRKIALTQGKFAVVDDIDFDNLSQFRWHAVRIGQIWYAGRSAKVNGCFKEWRMQWDIMGHILVDHKNGNGLDNRQENLRPCTKAQNIHN